MDNQALNLISTRLFAKVSSGKMPAIEAVRTARDIVTDYGNHNDQLASLAGLAAAGRTPSHAHRDLMTWCKTWSTELQPAKVSVTCRKQNDHGTALVDHFVLYPHEVFAELFSRKPELWKFSFVGPGGLDAIEDFWSRQKGQEWFEKHPSLRLDQLQHCIPLGYHADKGAHIKRDKILTISWGSIMSTAPTEWSKILFTILPDELAVGTDTAEELYAVLVWSMQFLALGVWPHTDHAGVAWPHGGRRACLAGKPLAGSWVLCLVWPFGSRSTYCFTLRMSSPPLFLRLRFLSVPTEFGKRLQKLA